jgi:hypothetical protein
MMKSMKRILVIAVAVLMAGCGLFDSGISWKSGRFMVYWIDLDSSSSLGYRYNDTSVQGIVEACVFAVGDDEKNIVVAQRPTEQPEVVNYYVVSKGKFSTRDPQAAVVGPMTEPEYRDLAAKSGLPKMKEVVPESVCRPQR